MLLSPFSFLHVPFFHVHPLRSRSIECPLAPKNILHCHRCQLVNYYVAFLWSPGSSHSWRLFQQLQNVSEDCVHFRYRRSSLNGLDQSAEVVINFDVVPVTILPRQFLTTTAEAALPVSLWKAASVLTFSLSCGGGLQIFQLFKRSG
ncbi:uncharacterized protein LOC110269878 [Arachis ipaensis]|uniref:uncharacterized protein LOC110269878 n=1 Tax=Arachis ipaensis TaxID=130454 RepID=UPI000A2B525E|nr:uncharacterized protein LOC110269878 [Arachis ipaensis]XP_025641646.1 uncharacterized protein LOC112736415 [Arachis hypogaea]